MKCKIRKGLLILSDCAKTTRQQCTECQRPMCDRHAVHNAGKALCTDCYAKQNENTSAESIDSAIYRHSFYQSNHYRGIYLGTYFDDYYSDYDMRSFDADYVGEDQLSDDGVGDFFDS